MSKKAVFVVSAGLVMLMSLAFFGCGSSQPAVQPVVKKVDHITISCSDPGSLFKTLTETLGLPVAWPLSSYGGFTTAGTNAVNVNIETLKFDQVPASVPTSIYGIVFEPYPLSDVMGLLEQRGADPGDPQDQMRDVNGTQVKVWTNVTLNALCTDNYIVYLCEYAPQAEAALAAHTTSGPLGSIGLMGVKEITVGSLNSQALREEWKNVFAPAQMSSDGSLSFESGPAVRIAQRANDSIVGLVLEVSSLDEARTFLSAKGLLGLDLRTLIYIDPTKIQGLNIALVEAE
jgi:hypothetical protein